MVSWARVYSTYGEMTSLPRLVFTCGSAADARGLFSCVSLRRGVQIAIQGSQTNPCADLASFLLYPPTPTPSVDANNSHQGSDLSQVASHVQRRRATLLSKPQNPIEMYDEFSLFVTGAVREFHVEIYRLDPDGGRLSWPLARLPALEALVLCGTRLSPGSLSLLEKEPILCPSLRTTAFFDCEVTGDVVRELEEVLTTRKGSTAARLHRVVIVNNTRALPDLQLVYRLRKFVPRVDIGVGELPDLL